MGGGSQLNCSYFYAVDVLGHWGNTSHFTFFSEFGRSWKGIAYIEAGFMTSLFVLAAIGNLFIIRFVLRHKTCRTITNYFVCNLALADILFVTSGPFISYIRVTETWRLGKGMCHFLNYEMFVCGFVMIWTMAVISIDRYICINMKTSQRRIKLRHVALICAGIWVVAFAGFLPVAIFFHVKTVQTEQGSISFCTVLLPRSTHFSFSWMFTVVLFISGFAIPLTIITVNYVRIFKKMWMSRRAVSNGANIVSMTTSMARVRRHARVIKTLVLLVVLFIVMLTPLFVVFGYIQIDNSPQYMNLSSQALIWTVVVAYCNAAINPFLYGFINNSLPRGLVMCCVCCGRRFSMSGRVSTAPVNAVSYRSYNSDN